MIFFLMLVRWTLPRFRYDQAMRLGWLGLFPLSIANIVITGAAILVLRGRVVNLRQRFYLVEVLSGVALTADHFFRNMGRHLAHALGRRGRAGGGDHPVSGGAPALLARGCARCTGWCAARTARPAAWRA